MPNHSPLSANDYGGSRIFLGRPECGRGDNGRLMADQIGRQMLAVDRASYMPSGARLRTFSDEDSGETGDRATLQALNGDHCGSDAESLLE